MTKIDNPKIVKKKLFSPIWLLPLVALVLSIWLGIKSYREAGVEIMIHFPSATGIDVGKTLVRYQGLTVGKVSDISIDKDLQGVDVKVIMDYRSEPFLRAKTQFWLVTPKASITGIEGLDALFSGNYIAIQPGIGDSKNTFTALLQPPPMQVGTDGIAIKIVTDSLSSLDVGSQVFYRQIPVGNIVNYRLNDDKTIQVTAFINQPYAHLVKVNSHFWNVSGIKVNASLDGVKINSESLTSILAGGIAFSSNDNGELAKNGDKFTLYNSEEQASSGVIFSLLSKTAEGISTGTAIYYRGVKIGQVDNSKLTTSGVITEARLFPGYQHLLRGSSQFYIQGADISLNGVKHASRIITGPIIQFVPGVGPAKTQYPLLLDAPTNPPAKFIKLTGTSNDNLGAKLGSNIFYKQFAIGKITNIKLSADFNYIQYQFEINDNYEKLLTENSYLFKQSTIDVRASLDGINIKAGNIDTLINGGLIFVPGDSNQKLTPESNVPLFESQQTAQLYFDSQQQLKVILTSNNQADVKPNSPVYYKKMQIGKVSQIHWNAKKDNFTVQLSIENEFKQLISSKTIFWQNSAIEFSASLTSVDLRVAPLKGAVNGSISIALLDNDKNNSSPGHLYENKELATFLAKPITLRFPVSTQLSANAAIRYQNYQIGKIEQVSLEKDLKYIIAKAYLYGDYAADFTSSDTQYSIVSAKLSLSGVKAPEALVTGPYVSAFPGTSKNKALHFDGSLKIKPYASTAKEDLKITLTRAKLGSIKTGTPIQFRGITIGEVKGYTLSPSGSQVLIYTAIESQYRHLINQSSKFWEKSGINLDLNIFSGAKINTESMESIIAGGIAVTTETKTSSNNKLNNEAIMPLYDQALEDWKNWQPAL